MGSTRRLAAICLSTNTTIPANPLASTGFRNSSGFGILTSPASTRPLPRRTASSATRSHASSPRVRTASLSY